MWVNRAEFHKMLVIIENREDPDRTAFSEAVLSGFVLFVSTFCKATCVLNFRTFTKVNIFLSTCLSSHSNALAFVMRHLIG